MKNYFTIAVLLHLLISFKQPAHSQTIRQNKSNTKAIAVVLKLTGQNSIPGQVQLLSKNVFTGKIKNIKTNTASQFQEAVHVKFFNDSGVLLYDNYQQNPLRQNIESSEPNGSLTQHEVVSSYGYLNFRFPISENVKNIKVVCSFIGKNVEKEISTLNIQL